MWAALKQSVGSIMKILSRDRDRPTALRAIGQLTGIMGTEMGDDLRPVYSLFQTIFNRKRGSGIDWIGPQHYCNESNALPPRPQPRRANPTRNWTPLPSTALPS